MNKKLHTRKDISISHLWQNFFWLYLAMLAITYIYLNFINHSLAQEQAVHLKKNRQLEVLQTASLQYDQSIYKNNTTPVIAND